MIALLYINSTGKREEDSGGEHGAGDRSRRTKH